MRQLVVGSLRLLAGRWPHAGYAAARVLATAARPLRAGPDVARLAAAFPHLSPAELRRARDRSASNALRAEALLAGTARSRGTPVYPPVEPNATLAGLRPPLIFASFHIGPYRALGEHLGRIQGELLVLHRGGSLTDRPGTVAAGDDVWTHARAFHRAVRTLRAGGSVFMAVDAFAAQDYEVSTLEVTMLGRPVWLARGAPALARMTGAPIVPVAARWSGSGVAISCGEPIGPEGGEQVAAAALARWFEDYLRRFPGEVSGFTLDLLRL